MSINSSEAIKAYTTEDASKFTHAIKRRRQEAVASQLDIAILAEQLSCTRARTFAREGLGRRIRVIERCVLNVFEIFPPDRDTHLTFNECDDVAIQLHAFAINVQALFDNLAWVLVLEAGLELEQRKVGLFRKECQAAIPQSLRVFLNTSDLTTWQNEFGKPYRDSTAHRIPLYLPPRECTHEDALRFQQLHAEALSEILSWRPGDEVDAKLSRHADLERQKYAVGRNSKFMALSLTGEDAEVPVFMHPQLLSDWALAHELIRVGAHSIRQAKGWPTPEMPPLEFS